MDMLSQIGLPLEISVPESKNIFVNPTNFG